VAQKVASGVYKGVTTSELDELAAETAASMTSKHPDYAQVRRTRPSPALSGTVWHEKTSAFVHVPRCQPGCRFFQTFATPTDRL
jgi:hypothetical protein